MWNLKNDINELIYNSETDRLRDLENKFMVTKGKSLGGGRNKLRGCDEHIHTIMYTIDNQQGPTVQHRELYSVFYNNQYGYMHN